MSTTFETEYGFVDAERYNYRLTVDDVETISQQLENLLASEELEKNIQHFITGWNIYAWYLEGKDNWKVYGLLNTAVKSDHRRLVRFVYSKLIHDDKIYSLDKVSVSSIRSQAMRDLLVKFTLRFDGDYEEGWLMGIRTTLRSISFN